MTKIFQKRSAAAIVMVLCILAGIAMGQMNKHQDLGETPATTLSGTYHYVLDSEGVISASTAEHIDAMNDSLFAQTGAQIVVQVVETTGEEDIDLYTEKEFERLGVGSAERDNGILLVLALKNYYNGAPVYPGDKILAAKAEDKLPRSFSTIAIFAQDDGYVILRCYELERYLFSSPQMSYQPSYRQLIATYYDASGKPVWQTVSEPYVE